ncbi:MAG: 1-acyl-sn-glycerol-3-phosphate acyltransferase [Bacteroidales bacterium]|nr:1-acyl-sn-glycerol-3-phosphate acyltransferase [Bacteroidales bacterium]
MNSKLLKNDKYNTPKNTKRIFWDKLMLNSRLYFYIKYFKLVLKSNKLAKSSKYDDNEWELSSYRIFDLIEKCGGKIHITGLDFIRNCEGPVIFVSNHMSTMETMIFPFIINPIKKITFVVKDSLVTHSYFGAIMRSRNPIVVSRSNSREDFKIVMEKGVEYLASGKSIVIFPQSTRSVEFIPKKFNSLGVKLASKAKVIIIPVAIKTDFWGNGKYLKEFGPINRKEQIHINFGEPLSVKGTGKEEHKKILEFISSNLKKWQE